MQTKFLELTSSVEDITCHINPLMICGITEYSFHSVIHTIGGQVYHVKESVEDIKIQIKMCESFTLITK